MSEIINANQYIKKGDKWYKASGGTTGSGDTTDLEQQIANAKADIEALDQRVEGNEEGIRDLYDKVQSSNANLIFADSEAELPDPSTLIENTMAFIPQKKAPVLSVNGVTPDENGNVEIETGGDASELEAQIGTLQQSVDDLEHFTNDIDNAVKNIRQLPETTEADNGKFVQVVNGAYALVALLDVSEEGM